MYSIIVDRKLLYFYYVDLLRLKYFIIVINCRFGLRI